MILTVVSGFFIFAGLFMGITAALGLFRLPDFYARTHAGGITDTLCCALILIGLMIYSGFNLVTVKLMFILILLWFTSPLSSHSLVKAAYQSGLKPKLDKQDESNRNSD